MQQDLFNRQSQTSESQISESHAGESPAAEPLATGMQLPESLRTYLDYWPEFLSPRHLSQLLPYLLDEIDWSRPELFVFGKWHPIPRQQAWFGDEGTTYEYSGKTMLAKGWTKPLYWLKQRIEAQTGFEFNSTLLNLYLDGEDKMGWHADDEPELGIDPAVAIVSLGEERDIQFRQGKKGPTTSLNLQSGSLLVMSPGMQRQFQHQIPSRKNVQGERFSLTFRYLIT